MSLIRKEESVKVVAHAGCEGTIPNSQKYIEYAMKSDCNIIEIDVRRYNNELLLSHDPLDLLLIKKSKEFPYMLFDEAAKRICEHTDKLINCDLKEDIIEDVIKKAQKTGVLNRLIFTGEADIKNSIAKDYCKQIYINVENNVNSELLDKIKQTNAAGINIEYRFVSEKLVKQVHERNMEILIWTVDDEEQMRKMLIYGVDGITSNYISNLIKIREDYKKNGTEE